MVSEPHEHCACAADWAIRAQAEVARLTGERDVIEHSLDAASSALFETDERRQRAVRWAWGYRRLARNWEWMTAHHIEQLLDSEERAATAVQRAEDAGACVLALETTVAQLERQRDAARAALKRYGRHEPGCHSLRTYLNEPHTRPCNCGLSAALLPSAAPERIPE